MDWHFSQFNPEWIATDENNQNKTVKNVQTKNQ